MSIWKSEVRDYEVDFQGIVNNANYYHYLDQARSLFFYEHGLNLKSCADNGVNIVICSSNCTFKSSLGFADQFFVETKLSKVTNLRLVFSQTIFFNHSLKISLESQSIICAVKKSTGRPFVFNELLRCVT